MPPGEPRATGIVTAPSAGLVSDVEIMDYH